MDNGEAHQHIPCR